MTNSKYVTSNNLDLISIENIQHSASASASASSSSDISTAATAVYSFTSISPLWINNDDLVTISYYSSYPKPGDWIAAYSPPNANILSTSPVKFGNCSSNHTNNYLRTGSGVLQFNMTNLRAGIQFVYFTGGLQTPVAQTTSTQIVNFHNINEPVRNRIVPTGNPNAFTLLWSAYNMTKPQLQWGLHPAQLVFTASANSTSIAKSSLCGAPANTIGWRDPGTIYYANFTGILDKKLSNQNISYRFGDASEDNWSQVFTFHVPPLAGTQPPNRPTKVVVFADLGIGTTDTSYDTEVWSESCPPAINTTMGVSDLIQRGQVDAVFHSGDIAYANGYMSSWDFFLDMIAPMSGSVAYLTTVGNHESDWPNTASYPMYFGSASGGECGIPATLNIPMPYPATTNEPWWSYDIGIIHFVGMSTEHNYTIGSKQYQWIENDLRTVDRTKTPWIIFSGHRPMYVDSDSCCLNYNDDDCATCYTGTDVSDMQRLQANVEPLLRQYQVNLAFSGHFHDMQRQSASYQNKTVQRSKTIYDADGYPVAFYNSPKATVYMVVGSAGNGPSIVSKQYDWSEKYWDNTYGYAVVTAVNATYLYWELINSAGNQVIDRVAITQNFQPWVTNDATSNSDNGLSTQSIILIVVFTVVFGLLAIAFFVKFMVIDRWLNREAKAPILRDTDEENRL